MRELRQDFIDKKQPQTCRKCWREERSGRVSKRMHTLDRLKHMLADQTEWTAEAKPLMFLDLKLGNICNLKCRICGSWSSSTYAAEEILAQVDRKNNIHYTMLRAGAWPRENPKFWAEISEVSDQIRYIEFTGGEPFMIEEHFELLQQLVDLGLAANIEIHYNTNGTIYPESAEAIWSHFRLVEIAVSIDDIGSRFEYQRSNAVWTEVAANVDRFLDLRAQHTNIQVQACITVNIFNVYYLEYVANWLTAHSFDFVYWNIMHDAEYFSVRSLPDTAKLAVEQALNQAQVDDATGQEFTNIVQFMRNGTSTDGSRMREEIARVDQRRTERFSEIFPDWATVLDIE
jgi:pyruvate-formate lyase-activating enzyme